MRIGGLFQGSKAHQIDRLNLILKYDQTTKDDHIFADKLVGGNKEIKINRHVKRI